MSNATDVGMSRCPECGRASTDYSLPRPFALFHWRRSIAAFIVPLFLAVILGWVVFTKETHRVGSGTPSPKLVEPPVLRHDLELIAAGEKAPGDPSLTALLLEVTDPVDLLPGRRSLEVGWAPAATLRSSHEERGWPSPWLQRTRYFNYENAVTRTGFRRAVTDAQLQRVDDPAQRPANPLAIAPHPRWIWARGAMVHRPPPEETGGVETVTYLKPTGFAAPVALIVVTWWISRFILALRTRLRRPKSRVIALAIMAPLVGGALFVAK